QPMVSPLPRIRIQSVTLPSDRWRPYVEEETSWENVDFSPDGYLLGSYRIATAPDPNSRRPTSFKSTYFESPANKVGPWPASLGCTTNSYSSITPSSVSASGSFTPPKNSPLPDSRLSRSTAFPRSPRKSSAFQSTRSRVLDTTYFLATSIVRAKGSIQSVI